MHYMLVSQNSLKVILISLVTKINIKTLHPVTILAKDLTSCYGAQCRTVAQ
jgi:hypothetical protein